MVIPSPPMLNCTRTTVARSTSTVAEYTDRPASPAPAPHATTATLAVVVKTTRQTATEPPCRQEGGEAASAEALNGRAVAPAASETETMT